MTWTYKARDVRMKWKLEALVLGAAIAAVSFATAPRAASGGTAPACIHRFANNNYREVGIVNECGKTMGVKVIVKWRPDSRCFVLFPQSIQKYRWALGTYGNTVTCQVQV
jgi:hypothetical protein